MDLQSNPGAGVIQSPGVHIRAIAGLNVHVRDEILIDLGAECNGMLTLLPTHTGVDTRIAAPFPPDIELMVRWCPVPPALSVMEPDENEISFLRNQSESGRSGRGHADIDCARIPSIRGC